MFDLDIDYISDDDQAACGVASLGVTGGDGDVRIGDAADVLAVRTSLGHNLNERGYCDYLDDSPATDGNCTPNPDAPNWDFRMVYEIWVRASAFDPTGFGSAFMSEVHASPSKAEVGNTVEVVPGECPCVPEIDTGECDPSSPPPPAECTPDSGECAATEFCHDGFCIRVVQ